MKGNAKRIAAAAITGAAYAVFTMVLAPLSYGAIQFRVSEVLCILPFFAPCTAWGLFFGCVIANLITGNIFDIVFGALATLAAALLTAAFGRKKHTGIRRVLACLMPVVFNALIVGAVITVAYNGQSVALRPLLFLLNCAQVGLGEAGVMFIIGLPLMYYLPKRRFFARFIAGLGYETLS